MTADCLHGRRVRITRRGGQPQGTPWAERVTHGARGAHLPPPSRQVGSGGGNWYAPQRPHCPPRVRGAN